MGFLRSFSGNSLPLMELEGSLPCSHSLLNPVHTLTPHFYQSLFNIILPFMPRFPKWSLLFTTCVIALYETFIQKYLIVITQSVDVLPGQELFPQMLLDPAVCQVVVRWEQNMENYVFSPQDHYPTHAASPGLRLLGKVLEFVHGTPMAKPIVNGMSVTHSNTDIKCAECQ
jgi:hypothetical protein